ncbi:MAG: tetratricopeptide repeat protein [Pseudomonadales bacterium]|nr:tetratricopeptide repeat protein [Pseudomonadales bacterium]
MKHPALLHFLAWIICLGGFQSPRLLAQELVQEPTEIPLGALVEQAENGNDDAQFELGLRYLSGTGLVQDEFQAASWFRKAAEQDNMNAQYNLGVMHLNGVGMIADQQEAVRWFRQAAENGDPPSQFTLAVLYANGRGINRDLMLAHMWFSLAAAAGDKNAAANAVLFEEMLSTEQILQSQSAAQAWIEKFNE